MLLTFLRTLVWAADGDAPLTRQVLRTEAYFRTLVHPRRGHHHRARPPRASPGPLRAIGQQVPSAWSTRDLEGRRAAGEVVPPPTTGTSLPAGPSTRPPASPTGVARSSGSGPA